jgi:hypothetical protein
MTTIVPFAVRRKTLVPKMAAIIVEDGTAGDEREAIRSLFGKLAMPDLIMLIDDARQAAQQEIVAREMSAP